MWSCPKCSESSDDAFDACWSCGASRDGSPPVPEPRKEVDCVRCRCRLVYDGTQTFHEGANWAQLGGLSELTVKDARFDRYRCPRCGRAELFTDPPEPT